MNSLLMTTERDLLLSDIKNQIFQGFNLMSDPGPEDLLGVGGHFIFEFLLSPAPLSLILMPSSTGSHDSSSSTFYSKNSNGTGSVLRNRP